MHEIATNIPAPYRPDRSGSRPWEPRITDEIRNLLSEPSTTVSVLVDKLTKQALVARGRYHGWKLITRKERDKFRVWRIA
jgi:hypothetical protein